MKIRHNIELHGNIVNRERAKYGDEPQATAVRELVDNCIDAGATLIEIELDRDGDTIRIDDDGSGCSDMSRFFDFGGTTKSDATGHNIGRYGIGGTWACMYLADTQEVSSIERTERVYRRASMAWTAAANGEADLQWEGLSQRPAKANEQHGTRILLRGIRRGLTNGVTAIFNAGPQKALINVLRKTYGAAISERCLLIDVNGETLVPVPDPEMIGGSRELAVFKQWRGLTYALRARHIAERDPQWEKGVYIAYRGRLLNDKARPWTTGLGKFAAAPVWVWVELIDTSAARWSLGWDKSDIADRSEMLQAAITDDEEVQAFLLDADTRAQDIDSTLLGEDLSALANDVLGPLSRVLEKRPGAAGEKGTVIPIESGIARRKASVVDDQRPGTIDEGKADRKHQSWVVRMKDLGGDGPMFNVYIDASRRKRHGELVDSSFTCVVEFNIWSDAQRARLRDKSVAYMLIAHAVSDGLRSEHPDLFKQIYRSVLGAPIEDMFGRKEDSQRLSHALLCRFDQQTPAPAARKSRKA